MMALPHHMDNLLCPAVVLHKSYKTIKGTPQKNIFDLIGYMSGIVGNKWDMFENLTNINWTAPRPIDSDKFQYLYSSLLQDRSKIPVAPVLPYDVKKLTFFRILIFLVNKWQQWAVWHL